MRADEQQPEPRQLSTSTVGERRRSWSARDRGLRQRLGDGLDVVDHPWPPARRDVAVDHDDGAVGDRRSGLPTGAGRDGFG